MASVKSIMRRDLVVASRDESVATAMDRMTMRDVGALIVLCDGRVCGILSERDVLRRVIGRGREPTDTRVGEVATPDPVAVGEETGIRACTELIREHGFRHLPIVDSERRPVGILSSRDLLQHVVEGLERYIDRQHVAQHREEMLDPYDTFGSAPRPAPR